MSINVNLHANYRPNFGIKIKVDKTKLKNLGQNIADSTAVTALSGTRSTSVSAYSSIAPFTDKGKWYIEEFFEKQKKLINRKITRINIRENNLPKTVIEKPDKEMSAISTGASLVSSGVGLYGSTSATAMAQSVHFPIYPLPENALEIVKNNPAERTAYEILFNSNNIGNDTASSIATVESAVGSLLNAKGVNITENAITSLKNIKKNIPS